MIIVTRAEWAGRKPKTVKLLPLTAIEGLAVHYSAAEADRTSDHVLCPARVRAIQNYHMDTKDWADIAYCVDEETEILTADGWKTYQALAVGDEALTLNHANGLAEWQPVMAVNVFPAQRRSLILMEGREHSSLTTPEHRWPVEVYRRHTGTTRAKGADGRWAATGRAPATVKWLERRWATSETLSYFDRIPVAAVAVAPVEAKWSDAFVEAVAWFWTEGHIIRGGRSVAIYQSHVKNPGNVARIRAALTAVLGPPVERFPRTGSSTDGLPRWREAVNGHKTEFYLSADAGPLLLAAAPGRVPTSEFLRALTAAQLELFITVSMAADNSGKRSLAQKNQAAAEAFALACILSGRAVSIRPKAPTTNTPYVMWQVQMMSKRHVHPRAAASRRAFRIEKVDHDGIVWCPTTPNGTWLARRKGSVYFTGNSFLVCQHGALFEGRGWNVRTAANGTNEANDHYLAVCFLGADKEGRDDVTEPGRAAIAWLWAEMRRRYQSAKHIVPHSSFKATQCPGNELRSWLAAGMPLAAIPVNKEVSPMFQPPHRLPPVVAELVPPDGRGVWLLSEDGSVWAYGGAGHKGAPNGQDYWGARRAVRLEPNGDAYDVVASTGERYSYP